MTSARFWTERRIFWAILALAAVVRGVAALPTVFHHPDELWQYIEPAYHIAVGPWVIACKTALDRQASGRPAPSCCFFP